MNEFEKLENSSNKYKNIVETLKKCLNNGKCTECKYGECEKPMLTCKDLIQEILNVLEGLF